MYSNLLEKKALEINNSYENKLKNQRIEYLNSENEQIRKNFFLTRIILLIIFLLVVILTLAFFRFRQKNRLLKKQQQEIIQIKDQLEVLLREIHHRIKNNLQVISSFLGIQKRNPNTLDTEVILSQCQDRIQTISLMHEQLYSQKEFEYIAIKFYLKKIIKNHIDTSFEAQNIDVNDKIENHSIDFERGLSLGIILNELLVNAAKYAFVDKRKGSISIVFKKKPSGFLFEVSDNGIGFPDNFAEENSNQSGIGYQIIWAMVNKLNGAMDFKSYKGAIISISFPY
jgi:two-component sensor histidine kinase